MWHYVGNSADTKILIKNKFKLNNVCEVFWQLRMAIVKATEDD